MAAILTANGIQFSDSTSLNSRRDIYPLGTAWIVYQRFAPTGWTKITTQTDKTLRVVSGDGGGSGGSISFSSAFPSATTPISTPVSASNGVNGTVLGIPEIASHSHGNGGSIEVVGVPALFNPDGAFTGWNGGDVSRPPVGNSAWTRNSPASGPDGSNDSHAHPFSGSGTFSTSIDLRVQYVDTIICTFDG